MPDQKQINRLKLMLDHAKRSLEMADPDMKIVEKLLSDALSLAAEINEPPNPYADQTVRPGLNYIDPRAKFHEPDDGVALTSASHPGWPPQENSDG
jgi:hypothetical protein